MRLIDADAFNHFDYSCFDGQLSEDAIQGIDTVLNVIDTAPTIDAAPARHGHWIETIENGKMKRVTSCCGDNQTTLTCWCTPRYCPNCGAKMDGGIIEAWKERANEPPRNY